MPADSRRATTFLLGAGAWSVALFALFRAPAVEQGLVLPLTVLQQRAAEHFFGAPSAPIAVTLECSGTDVLALCLAGILACPVAWRARVTGGLGAVAFIVALNTLRIATLGGAAASPDLFARLHLQVWPAILSLAAAGYVLFWMRALLGRRDGDSAGEPTLAGLARRFAPRAAVLLVVFALCGPWIAASEWLVAAGAGVAGTAALVLAGAGVAATATGNILTTSRGAFLVTPDCLATALVPVYAAAVLTARRRWAWRGLALALALPVFAALAVVRLLLLALPPVLAASPLFLVHGFHQLVLGVVAVAVVAWWRARVGGDGKARPARRALAAVAAAIALALAAGGAWTAIVTGFADAIAALASHAPAGATNPGDAQGALALLPAYQAALLLALAVAAVVPWRRLAAASAALFVFQVALLVILGEIAEHANIVAHALLLRALAVAVPGLLTIAMLRTAPPAAGTPLPLRPAVDGPH